LHFKSAAKRVGGDDDGSGDATRQSYKLAKLRADEAANTSVDV